MSIVTLRVLTGTDVDAAIPALAAILSDCVEGGASVGFMAPFPPEDAIPFWQGVAAAVKADAACVIVAEREGEIVGTVQLGLAMPPNQPHRADVKKMLVHRKARRTGVARHLMMALEVEAARRGRRVLVLDTVTGSVAYGLYIDLGWQRVGDVPDFALMPDGAPCSTTFFYRHLTPPA
ncbi:GNAT family N-acetyltransferase [Ensifer soli]|uniref:GNAT family N-acetyltransferase n=1 Tax=Ciceribacter sp. sgz301302 TaxID=3342379 RepID=UPI0035B71FD5